jgi:hypothetical protein
MLALARIPLSQTYPPLIAANLAGGFRTIDRPGDALDP